MSENSKKVLVTGGAGFIGANFIEYVLKKYPEYKVICIDKLTYAGNKETLLHNKALTYDNFSFFEVDICDALTINRIFDTERPDWVVNFAAESHVDRSIANPELFLRTNVWGTQVLLEASKTFGVQRFHQVSTDEVYGDAQLNSTHEATEKTQLCPSTPYSASKAAADMFVLSYMQTFGLPATISRCSNNYGPYQHIEKLIPLTIQRLLNGEKLKVHGQGTHIRDWIHVTDHCKAIDCILHNGTASQIYNVSGETPKSSGQIMQQICNWFGVSFEDNVEYVPDRPGNDMRYAMCTEKMRTQLQWKPEKNFDTELNNTIEWYTHNQEWVKSFQK